MAEIDASTVRPGAMMDEEAAAASFESALKGRTAQQIREQIIKYLLIACAGFSILVTIGIIVAIFGEAIPFFLREEVTLVGFLTGTRWAPIARPVAPDNFGVLPLINGTLMITVLSGLIAIPIGLGAAIYLSEYAAANLRSILKPLLEILAGVPTVVYGYFALSLITPLLRDSADAINGALGTDIEVGFFNALAASVVVGVMLIPTVASISEDALRAVPRGLRQGAYGLGANKFEVTTRVVVPAALSGVFAAFILGLSRAIGETMAVTIAAGATPRMTLNPLESVQTMTAYIVQVSFGDTPLSSINGQSIFAVGATLFLMTLAMNIVSNLVVRRFREEYD